MEAMLPQVSLAGFGVGAIAGTIATRNVAGGLGIGSALGVLGALDGGLTQTDRLETAARFSDPVQYMPMLLGGAAGAATAWAAGNAGKASLGHSNARLGALCVVGAVAGAMTFGVIMDLGRMAARGPEDD